MPVASASAITRLAHHGGPTQRAGSFAGKTAASVLEGIARLGAQGGVRLASIEPGGVRMRNQGGVRLVRGTRT